MSKTSKVERIRYVALLRGINVGGHKMIRKETLIDAFVAAGLAEVRTYIQSGNVLFESPETDRPRLIAKIEQSLLASTGHTVPTILRTLAEIQALVASDPFGARKTEPKAYTSVAFLSSEPSEQAIETLLARQTARDLVEVRGTESIHLWFKEPGDRAPFSIDFVEKDLAMKATVRNWNTISKIAVM